MYKNKVFNFALALIVSATFVSCGSDNAADGTATSVYGEVSTATIESNEGSVVAATSTANFRELVAAGKFARANTSYFSCYTGTASLKYHLESSNCSVNTDTSDWWIFSSTSSSLDCNPTGTQYVYENISTGTLSGTVGTTKADVINSLLSIIDSADSTEFSYGGTNPYQLVVKQGNRATIIDLNRPIAANPVIIDDYTSSTDWSEIKFIRYETTCEY